MFERISPTRYTLLETCPYSCSKRLLQSERSLAVHQMRKLLNVRTPFLRAIRTASRFSMHAYPVMNRLSHVFGLDHGSARGLYV